MNGFGFLGLGYSVYELIAPHSVRVPLKNSYFYSVLFSLSFLCPFFGFLE